MRIAIIGAGVAGSIVARALGAMKGLDVTCLERVAPDDHSEAGTGLNVGPNAVKVLTAFDPALAAAVTRASLPWGRWRISLTDGTVLFDRRMRDLADQPGWRIRWSELYQVLRDAAGDTVRYGCQIESSGRGSDGRLYLEWRSEQAPHRQRLEGIDLLIAADGRYSDTRQAWSGEPVVEQVGVAIFRLLVSDAGDRLGATASGIDDYEQWFNGPNRLLAFRVPGDFVYIAGTFPLPPGEPVPAAMKTAPALRKLYEPAQGEASAQARWLIDAVAANAESLHWARLQQAEALFADPVAPVLYLGDSAHGMVPTLGQGATQAIEDACVAARLIVNAWQSGERDVRVWLQRVERERSDRIGFATRFSLESSDTLLQGADPVMGTLKKNGPAYLERLEALYRDIELEPPVTDARNPSARRRSPADPADPSDMVDPADAADTPADPAAGGTGITHGLFHLAIKTADLDATRAFWCGVIGLREVARPDFGYPGAWLACPQPGGQAIIHVYAGGPAMGPEGIVGRGTAAIDHVSLACSGYHAYRSRLRAAGLDWREFLVPGTTLWQLFVYDPSGVQLELTFEGSVERGPPPDLSPRRVYRAGVSFLC